jgi:uncharacterized protein (TIGR02611 family)
MRPITRGLRVVAITTVGSVLLLAGVVMWFTPGPGWLAVLGGLWVLSLEFRWAQGLLQRVERRVADLRAAKRTRRGAADVRPGHPHDLESAGPSTQAR